MGSRRSTVFALLAGLVSAAWFTSPASADIYLRDKAGGENHNGNSGGYFRASTGGVVKLKFDGLTWRNQALGMYDFQMNDGGGWEDLLSFCIDPFQYLNIAGPNANPGTPHQEVSLDGYAQITDDEEDLIEILWANAFEEAKTDKKKASAFQVILWEMAIDDNMNLTNGTFQVKNENYSGQVLAQADIWINNVLDGIWTDRQQLNVLASSQTQDLLIPVPAPGAVLLGLIGLAAVRAVRRRVA